MKKRIFLLLPFLFIMNCEETEDTDDGSIEGNGQFNLLLIMMVPVALKMDMNGISQEL